MIVSPLFWVAANIVVSLGGALVAVYLLRAHFERFTPTERQSLGMIGAGQLMRCAPIFARNMLGQNSPFDDWSTLLVGAGVLLGAWCLLRRLDSALAGGVEG